MNILVISSAPLIFKGGKYKAYAPYAKEMNIWKKYSDEILFCCPIWESNKGLLVSKFNFLIKNPIKLLDFNLTTKKNLYKVPILVCINSIKIVKAMRTADHIHLRCPGNIGLLACIAQIGFPSKPKTIKYAGNWDPKSKQPWSYKLQKWILSNTFLTRNAKVLVYGKWPNQTKNIVPFFTASYSEKEIYEDQRHSQQATERSRSVDWESHDTEIKKKIPHKVRNDENKCHPKPVLPTDKLVSRSHPNAINFIFVGGLTSGKQPLLSVQVVHELKKREYEVQLTIYGDGVERANIENYIVENKLQQEIILYGNVSKEIIKEAYKKSHFLVFLSKSEGWPKVVAEAMFWGCLPISSHVSCIPFMLGNGSRGAIANPNINEIVSVVESYICDNEKYQIQVKEAMEWSRQYTLEKFEEEIGKLLK